jgi:MSHA pilin protein MshA
MKPSHTGFTLIELITVIVILGILAAVALPKFVNLTQESVTASVQSVAGAVGSGSAINFGAYTANSSKAGVTAVNTSTASCSVAFLSNFLRTGLTSDTGGITYAGAGAQACGAAGNSYNCTLTGTKGTVSASATARVICTG